MKNFDDFVNQVSAICGVDNEKVREVLQVTNDMLDSRLFATIKELGSNDFTILEEGHKYRLTNGETLTFVKKEKGKEIHDGTTNEEVVRVLINRMRFLQSKLPCRENAIIITKLEEVKFWLDERTRRRMSQGIETMDVPHRDTEVR